MVRRNKGSASVELVAVLPLVALCTLVMVQVFGVFVDAAQRLQAADAQVSQAMREHMSLASEHGFEWPCLERVSVGSDGKLIANGIPKFIGVGSWKQTIETLQEVTFVTGEICSD